MHPTRRFVSVAAAASVLWGLGLLAQRPLAILGGAGLATWLVTTQYAGLGEFRRLTEGLDVTVSPVQDAVVVEESVTVTTQATLARPAPNPVRLSLSLPPGASVEGSADRTLTIERGERRAETTVSCSFAVAGEFDLPSVTVELENVQGTVTERLQVDSGSSIRVDPRRPRNVHIGQGGDRVAAYGEHPAGTGDGGLVPEEIRQYVPGDALDQIDWKATARLQAPHVREFETETDRTVVIAIDHSAAMATGPEGETMLDYAREVGLGYARAAEAAGDPLGLYAIGDEGVTVRRELTTSPSGYRHLRNALHDLSPTDGTRESQRAGGSDHLSRPADARAAAHDLADEDTAFARTVAPFLADTDAYVQRIEDDPLFETVRRIRAETTGEVWLILLTADTNRNRVRDAAALLSGDSGYASVFLTPQVLFEAGGLEDLQQAYDRYVSFEEFRKEVDRIGRTDAYELGPGDRLDALLAARERRRQ